MSFSNNKTYELWHRFMPRKKLIKNSLGIERYSIEVYPASFFKPFYPDALFEKWAVVEVADFNNVPDDMETFSSPGGLYAIFDYTGPVSEGPITYKYIFGTWLPDSDFNLDNRPHFAVMGEKYRYNDPKSEEELWIPVVPK